MKAGVNDMDTENAVEAARIRKDDVLPGTVLALPLLPRRAASFSVGSFVIPKGAESLMAICVVVGKTTDEDGEHFQLRSVTDHLFPIDTSAKARGHFQKAARPVWLIGEYLDRSARIHRVRMTMTGERAFNAYEEIEGQEGKKQIENAAYATFIMSRTIAFNHYRMQRRRFDGYNSRDIRSELGLRDIELCLDEGVVFKS